jgi:PPOX class probable F420-dependent enzyme
MPKLRDAERDEFLRSTPGMIMNIATVDASGAPLVTPIWFVFEEGRIWFTPRQHSEWLQHLRHDPRVALSIDEPAIPYRKVVVRGRARIDHEVGEDARWRDRYRRIAQRYIPATDANAYVDGTDDQPRALCSVNLAEAEVRSWRMPVGDEAYDGIWARRYWTADAKVKRQSPKVFDRSAE